MTCDQQYNIPEGLDMNYVINILPRMYSKEDDLTLNTGVCMCMLMLGMLVLERWRVGSRNSRIHHDTDTGQILLQMVKLNHNTHLHKLSTFIMSWL